MICFANWVTMAVAGSIGSCVALDDVDVIATCKLLYFCKVPNSRLLWVLEEEEVAIMDLFETGLHSFSNKWQLLLSQGFELVQTVFACIVEILIEDVPERAFGFHNDQKWSKPFLGLSPRFLALVLGEVVAVDEVIGLERLEVILMGEEGDVGMTSVEFHDVHLGCVDSAGNLLIGLALGSKNLSRPFHLVR